MRERALCVLRADVKDFSIHMQAGRRYGTRCALP
jgi:hypothetical protein